MMDIDHIFIRSQYAAPEAEALKAFGLTEASANMHTGQGTASRRFFFNNLFLELLYIDHAEQAQSQITQPTQLYQRLDPHNTHISPFGVCFRPHNHRHLNPSFASWHYQPAYLPAHLHVDIAENLSLAEPMWFFLSFATRPDQTAPERQQPRQHLHNLSEVTAIKLHMPKRDEYLTFSDIQQVENFELIESTHHLLELTFDDARQQKTHDFRPELALIFHY